MRTLILASLFALNTTAALAAPLTIEPSEAFGEAFRVSVDLARHAINDADARVQGQVQLHRGKNELGEFGDFRSEFSIGSGRGSKNCNVYVMIRRLPLAERPADQLVLETDHDLALQTIAQIMSVRCQ